MTSPIDRSQLANFAVDPGALPVAAYCVFPSHSRPSPSPPVGRLDASRIFARPPHPPDRPLARHSDRRRVAPCFARRLARRRSS